MRTKFPIHTTLKKDVINIIEKRKEEFGGKGVVIEEALYVFEEKLSGEKRANERKHTKISTGSKKLNDMLDGGIHTGSRVCFVGPSGCGKTAIALEMLNNVMTDEESKEHGDCILISSIGIDEIVTLDGKFGMNLMDYKNKGKLIMKDHYNYSELCFAIREDFPNIVLLDDITTLLGERSLYEFFRSGEWDHLTKLLKRSSTVLIITSTAKAEFIRSAFNVTLEMDRIEIADRIFATTRVIKSSGHFDPNQVLGLTFNEGYLKFYSLRKVKPKEKNVDSSIVKRIPIKDKEIEIKELINEESIEDDLRKPIENEIVEILFSQEAVSLSHLARNLGKVGYLSRSSINPALERLAERGVITIQVELKNKIIFLNNKENKKEYDRILKEIFFERISVKSPVKAAIIKILITQVVVNRKQLMLLMREEGHEGRAVGRSLRRMILSGIVKITERDEIEQISLAKSFCLGGELD